MFRIVIAILFLLPSTTLAMDTDLFDGMIEKIRSNDFKSVEAFLDSQKVIFENDPEYYVILLNYSFTKGYQDHVVVAKGEAKEGDLELRDRNTGEPIGFLGSRTINNTDLIAKGISETQKALPHFQNRLDIHFGIIQIASKIERWDIVGEQSVQVLLISKSNNNKWTWGPINSMEDNPEKFMIGNIQSYVNKLFYVGTPESDGAVEKISQTMIKTYPKVVFGYTNLGALYLAKKEYDLAEKNLKMAMDIAPDDEIVKKNYEKLQDMKQ
jgi:tetratricopeptide (TPR) repeat protein